MKTASHLVDDGGGAGPATRVTAADVRAEHETALASLTAAQRRALARVQDAQQQSCFNHRWPSENLDQIFEAEADWRNHATLRPAAKP